MKVHLIFRLSIILSAVLFMSFIQITVQTSPAVPVLPQLLTEKGLFDTDDVLQITLRGKISELLNDRSDNPKNHPLTLSYRKEDSSEMMLPVQVKTRGHFRKLKGNCTYPPLLIQFTKEESYLSSVFREQSKLKLVMPCRGDEYVIREWLVYKLYNLVTPQSFRARLVKVKLENADSKKSAASFYGILLEEEKQMAKRNHAVAIERKVSPEQVQKEPFLTMSVFEYLVGNTDWSVQYLQNIKLLSLDSNAAPVAVPYDFDHAGIVNAPYAMPAEQLQLGSVRERRYRGYCVRDLKVFEPVIARYNHLKSDIYNLYSHCTLLDTRSIKSTIQYLDEFYKTISNPKAWQKEFAYPCDKNGTGNVVIKGLKED